MGAAPGSRVMVQLVRPTAVPRPPAGFVGRRSVRGMIWRPDLGRNPTGRQGGNGPQGSNPVVAPQAHSLRVWRLRPSGSGATRSCVPDILHTAIIAYSYRYGSVTSGALPARTAAAPGRSRDRRPRTVRRPLRAPGTSRPGTSRANDSARAPTTVRVISSSTAPVSTSPRVTPRAGSGHPGTEVLPVRGLRRVVDWPARTSSPAPHGAVQRSEPHPPPSLVP